ncbi:muscular LMNA-interacting protein [Cricetulus griseus]|uniref:Muscular LMNA-interacting protein n=1 Tax=Cricetulus griseus TaxID=10029 RepID=A0A061I9K4_CRIGR|nr:muscular LMNA-interacting protein [Cricetulus griseus]
MAIPHRPVSLHPLYQSKLYPKTLLHPQTLSHADCLTPGPFSHLSSFSLRDEQEKSPTFLSQDTYNKEEASLMIAEQDTDIAGCH